MKDKLSSEGPSKEVLPPEDLISTLREQFPGGFRLFPEGLPDRQPDPVVGVPFETNANRSFWLDQIREVLLKGRHIVIVIVDLDQLKHYNETYSRQVGDVGILYTANSGAELVDELFLSSGAKLEIVSRESHAADETLFVLSVDENFPGEERLQELRQKARTIPPVRTWGVPRNKDKRIVEEVAMTFSLGAASSRDPEHLEFYRETMGMLKDRKLKKPFDLFKLLKRVALEEADGNKNEKIEAVASEIIEKEVLTPYGLARRLSERFSGYRLKEKVHLFIIRKAIELTISTAVQVAVEFGLDKEKFREALEKRTK